MNLYLDASAIIYGIEGCSGLRKAGKQNGDACS